MFILNAMLLFTIGCNQDADSKRKQCDDGNLSACVELGDRFKLDTSVSQHHKRAADLYQKACNGENYHGCERLGDAHEKGLGVIQNTQQAATYYDKACNGGNMRGCAGLAILNESEAFPEADKIEGRKLLEKACEAKDPKGCSHLGQRMLSENNRLATARHHLEVGCKGDEFDACTALGEAFINGVGGDIDEVRGKVYWNRVAKPMRQRVAMNWVISFIYSMMTPKPQSPHTKKDVNSRIGMLAFHWVNPAQNRQS